MNDNPIISLNAVFDEVGCDKRQAMRFSGCPCDGGSSEIDCIYDSCVSEIAKEVFFKAVWRKTSLSFCGDDTIEFDFGKITSASLCKNLEGCKSAYVFAATAGHGVDRLILRCKHIDSAKAMILSGVGSSCIECWCDKVNEEIAKGKKSKPRFSPGYGGVKLEHQKEILSFLDAERKIGITLTDSYFMTPVKSVTAFIGIEEE